MVAWKVKVSNNSPKVTVLLALSKKTVITVLEYGTTQQLKRSNKVSGQKVKDKSG